MTTARALPLLLVVLLLPPEARPCSLRSPEPWKQSVGDLEVAAQPTKDERGLPKASTLTVSRGGKLLWTRALPRFFFRDQVVLSKDGRHTALILGEKEGLLILGQRGEELARWNPLDLLQPSERASLTWSSCGLIWLTAARWEGAVLVADLPIRGVVPPMYEQPPGLIARYDVQAQKASRPPVPPPAPVKELVARFRAERSMEALDALLRRSVDEGGPHRELADFWLEHLRNPDQTARGAVEAFGQVATVEDLRRAMALPPHPDRDLALLHLLERRSPPDAARFAAVALQQGREPDLLRVRALGFVTGSGRAHQDALQALKMAIKDSSPRVRDEAARVAPSAAPPLEAAALLMPLLEDGDEDVRARAAIGLQEVYGQAKTEDGGELVRRLERLERDTGLKRFPEGYLILATVAHARDDLRRARELYRRADEALSKVTGHWEGGAARMRVEVWAQRALLAKAAGDTALAQRLAKAIRAEERHGNTQVCAPAPGEYAALVLPTPPCRRGQYGAQTVIDRAFGRH